MKLAKIFLAIGVAVLYAVFFCYGVYVVYEPPQYEQDTCYLKYNCESSFNQCYGVSVADPKVVATPVSQEVVDKCVAEKQVDSSFNKCNEDRNKCSEEFRKDSNRYYHARNSFYILAALALLSIVGGLVFLSKLESIGPGIWGGGILIALYALPYTSDYWMQWHKYAKLIVLGVLLATLIYFGYKKIEQRLAEKK